MLDAGASVQRVQVVGERLVQLGCVGAWVKSAGMGCGLGLRSSVG